MKSRTFKIKTESDLKLVLDFLNSQTGEVEILIREPSKDRSLLQNQLYWMWVTIIADELGHTKEEIHEDLKKRLLCPIFERDEPGYAEMINSVRKIYTQGFKQDAIKLHEHIVRLTSTTSATVSQFTEYLKEIERDMVGKGIILPHPEDRYQFAMGKNEI